MPTYEYACRACGHRFETVHSMTADPLTVCPECGGELRKVLHAAGIVFKGSGFYATDSRSKPPSGQGKKEADAKDAKEPAKSEPAKEGPAKEGPAKEGPAKKEPAKDPSGSSGSSSSGGSKKEGGT